MKKCTSCQKLWKLGSLTPIGTSPSDLLAMPLAFLICIHRYSEFFKKLTDLQYFLRCRRPPIYAVRKFKKICQFFPSKLPEYPVKFRFPRIKTRDPKKSRLESRESRLSSRVFFDSRPKLCPFEVYKGRIL